MFNFLIFVVVEDGSQQLHIVLNQIQVRQILHRPYLKSLLD